MTYVNDDGSITSNAAPRYRLVGYDIGTEPDANGGWVHWTDYARLEAEIATLEAALADMTQQRDAAMAGVVKVKPLVFSPWSSGGCMGYPQPFRFFITQMQDENGDFLCHWDSSTYKTLDEAKAHAQACYLPPDPDRAEAAEAREAALLAAERAGRGAVIDDVVRLVRNYPKSTLMLPEQARVCEYMAEVIIRALDPDATAALEAARNLLNEVKP